GIAYSYVALGSPIASSCEEWANPSLGSGGLRRVPDVRDEFHGAKDFWAEQLVLSMAAGRDRAVRRHGPRVLARRIRGSADDRRCVLLLLGTSARGGRSPVCEWLRQQASGRPYHHRRLYLAGEPAGDGRTVRGAHRVSRRILSGCRRNLPALSPADGRCPNRDGRSVPDHDILCIRSIRRRRPHGVHARRALRNVVTPVDGTAEFRARGAVGNSVRNRLAAHAVLWPVSRRPSVAWSGGLVAGPGRRGRASLDRIYSAPRSSGRLLRLQRGV